MFRFVAKIFVMNLKFIGLGSNAELENSLGNHLVEAFAKGKYDKLFIISAFSSVSAVKGVVNLSKEFSLNDITIITGIDQGGTSKEALNELLNSGFKSYIFYSSSSEIFHPKIYLFENKSKIEILIGSSNLTTQGLFRNTEASVGLLFDKERDSLGFIEEVKENYESLFSLSDPNLIPITEDIIEKLLELKIIPTEAERKLTFKKTLEGANDVDVVKKMFPKRKRLKLPDIFKNVNENIKKGERDNNIGISEIFKSSKGEVFVWESSALTERDLNIPSGKNTNPTGSMLFKKGKDKLIDQRHHFREEVFAHLNWEEDKKQKHLERTRANFKIVINGDERGVFNLKLTHNKDVKSKSYLQKNSMTNISWGGAINHIASSELIGKKLKLYREDDSFIIKID